MEIVRYCKILKKCHYIVHNEMITTNKSATEVTRHGKKGQQFFLIRMKNGTRKWVVDHVITFNVFPI